MSWVAVAPPDVLVTLEPLAAAHARSGPTRLVATEDLEAWQAELPGARALLVVGTAGETPSTALRGPLEDVGGRAVPVGWLPADSGLTLAVRAMAEAAARSPSRGPVALIGGHGERYRALLQRVEAGIEGQPVHRWDAARASRHTMLSGLALGPALALYAGHGTPRGLAAYGGVSGRDLAGTGLPLGALVCLTCHAATRPRRGLSFAEEAVLAGAAAAVLAANDDVTHEEHVGMAGALLAALNAGVSTIGELVCQAALPASLLSRYRIVGDPAAPLAAAVGAAEACAQIAAPALGEPIPALPAGWWPSEAVNDPLAAGSNRD